MVTSRNAVSPFKTVMVDFDNLTRDYLINDGLRYLLATYYGFYTREFDNTPFFGSNVGAMKWKISLIDRGTRRTPI